MADAAGETSSTTATNLDVLRRTDRGTNRFDLVYLDPPFQLETGAVQRHIRRSRKPRRWRAEGRAQESKPSMTPGAGTPETATPLSARPSLGGVPGEGRPMRSQAFRTLIGGKGKTTRMAYLVNMAAPASSSCIEC